MDFLRFQAETAQIHQLLELQPRLQIQLLLRLVLAAIKLNIALLIALLQETLMS